MRKTETTITETAEGVLTKDNEYFIQAVKIKDHALIKIIGKSKTVKVIIALPDSARFTYIGLTGEFCRFYNVSIDKAEHDSPADFIPRIAEEISYINVPAGDLPNVQIDGYRTDSSEGVEIKDGLRITFHAMNLPTARLVWHCPFVDIFTSDDGKVNGENYRDLAFLRFDGEAWECDDECDMKLNVNTLESFEGWDAWKQYIKDGFDAVVDFSVKDNLITITTENAGIAIKNTAVINGVSGKVYATITGDQVAITNIRVSQK